MIRNKKYPYYEQLLLDDFKQVMDVQLERNPDEIAFSYREDDKIIDKTFKETCDDINNLASYFYTNYKNKNIALIGENSYSWFVLFMAIAISGNIIVSIDKDVDEELLNKLLKQADCKDVYFSKEYCPFIDKMKVNKKYIEDIEDFIEEGKKEKNEHIIDPDAGSVIFFTSGTTGPNKAVLLSQRNITSNLYGATSLFWFSGSTVSLLPYHHCLGLLTGTLKPFYYGHQTFINNSLRHVMDDICYVKAETLVVVPLYVERFYKQIWKTAKKNGEEEKLKKAMKISNFFIKLGIDVRRKLFKSIIDQFGGELAFIICGGAYLDQKYIDFFYTIGITVLNGYGITECAPVLSVNRNYHIKRKSVGLPCRGDEIKVIDGEICVKGPNVMLGYYKDDKATDSVIKDGYFHTGDLGYLDKDGFIFITGRKKNIIILNNGENVSPEMIEEELVQDDGVCEVVVYAEDDKLIAAIFPEEEYLGNQEYFDNLIYNYNKDKPLSKQVATVKLRDKEFVKNNNRKILRNKVLEGE